MTEAVIAKAVTDITATTCLTETRNDFMEKSLSEGRPMLPGSARIPAEMKDAVSGNVIDLFKVVAWIRTTLDTFYPWVIIFMSSFDISDVN